MVAQLKKDFIIPILVLMMICFVASGALSLVNSVTGPVIEAEEEERTNTSMHNQIPSAIDFEPVDKQGLPSSVYAVYRATNDAGYVFIVTDIGFSGEVKVICGIDPDGRLTGSEALEHSETKGIGTIIDQASFTDQFIGKDSRLEGVSTVTGATISTSAYVRAIEAALEAFEIISKR